MWTKKHVLGINELSVEEIYMAMEKGKEYLEKVEKKPEIVAKKFSNRAAVNLFFEVSTRTRMSFELAQKQLGMSVLNYSAKNSSMVKGESFIDTLQNIDAMNVDVIVIRHVEPETPLRAAEFVNASILNGGDGAREHPTQALLDFMTIWLRGISFEGLHVAIVGDILHSRVARSEVNGLLKLGAKVTLVGPQNLIPADLVAKSSVNISFDLDEVLPEIDILYLLRIQKERMVAAFIPDEREYFRLYGLNRERLDKTKDSLLVMHPGPINRNVEIADDIVAHKKSVILEQVKNGVAMRMGLLDLVLNRRMEEELS